MTNFLFRYKMLSVLLLGGLTFSLVAAFPFFKSTQFQSVFSSRPDHLKKETVAANFTQLVKSNAFPDTLDIKTDEEVVHASVKYTLDAFAQDYIEKELQKYRPDYGAFVAMDARTGRILAMSSYQREGERLGNLALRATFPAASVFKVVTAAAALDQKKVTADTHILFNGANHTLYRRNVMGSQNNRWTRTMSLRQAFAKSVNTVFGKIGVTHVGPQNLREYANRFMFNQTVRADFPALMGFTTIQEGDDWQLAETSSGFTRTTTMSPLQGVLIAAAVANDGVMMEPSLIDSLTNSEGKTIYDSSPSIASIAIHPQAAADLRLLMQETVTSGTSRPWFRKVWKRKQLTDDLELGGKTGSLTGMDPRGRYDWFVGYMRYRDQKIAVSALTINEEKWRVKSAYLAGEFLSQYLRQQKEPSQRLTESSKRPSRRLSSQ